MPPVFPKSVDKVFGDTFADEWLAIIGVVFCIYWGKYPRRQYLTVKNGNTPMGSSSFLWDFQKLMKDWWRAKNVAESSAYSGALYFPPRFLSPSFLGEELPRLEDFILLVYLFCFPPSTLLDNFLFSESGFSPPEKKVSLFAVQIFIFYLFYIEGAAGQTLSLDLQRNSVFFLFVLLFGISHPTKIEHL